MEVASQYCHAYAILCYVLLCLCYVMLYYAMLCYANLKATLKSNYCSFNERLRAGTKQNSLIVHRNVMKPGRLRIICLLTLVVSHKYRQGRKNAHICTPCDNLSCSLFQQSSWRQTTLRGISIAGSFHYRLDDSVHHPTAEYGN